MSAEGRVPSDDDRRVSPGEDGYDDAFDMCPEPTCPLYGKAVMADHRHLDTPAARRRRGVEGRVLSDAEVDLLAGATAEKHRANGLPCACGAFWTEYHQAREVGRAVRAALTPPARTPS